MTMLLVGIYLMCVISVNNASSCFTIHHVSVRALFENLGAPERLAKKRRIKHAHFPDNLNPL